MKLFSRHGVLEIFKNNFQLVYGLILLILVPAALLVITLVFTSNMQKVMNQELLRKADMANKLVSAQIPALITDQQALQSYIERTKSLHEDIHSIDILVPEGANFKIVASLDKKQIGVISKFTNNTIAWQREELIAFETTSNALSTEDEMKMSDQHFWVVVNPIKNSDGVKTAIVAIKLSSSIIDELTSDYTTRSVIIVVAAAIVIILLLLNNTRLFQYSILFRRLKEVDQMKDEFISMASHELRAPITGIRGYLQMITDGSFGALPAEANAKLHMVLQESNRLHDLVEDLLEVSRIEQGRIKLTMAPYELKLLAESVVMTFEQQAKEKNLKLSVQMPTDIPKIFVDEARFKQIIVNLVSNAIKYTPKGSVAISAELVRGKEDSVKIKVADTGMGMSAKDREHLFEKFYRVRNEKTDKITGTGLGLWITKQVVELMKGEIYVDSIENVGTQVTILLPPHKDKQ
ncbi:MAG: HAMP domain-containing sensor histidine kinase [Patescibacteria group bacterium]|nr:HAMP domain-containing sensor histidine kinase [Patescibacteria group bacterium]